MAYPVLTAREVVEGIRHGQTVSFSGFSPAGAAKAVPEALADYAREQHDQGKPFKVRILTGASSATRTRTGRCLENVILRTVRRQAGHPGAD